MKALSTSPTTVRQSVWLPVTMTMISLAILGAFLWRLNAGATTPATTSIPIDQVAADARAASAASEVVPRGGMAELYTSHEPARAVSTFYVVASQWQADWLRRVTVELEQIVGQPVAVDVMVLPLDLESEVLEGVPFPPGTQLIDLRRP